MSEWAKKLSVACIAFGLLIMLNQWMWWPGDWFDTAQMFHHEYFASILIAFGVGILIARRFRAT